MRQNALKARPKRRRKPQDDGECSVIADNVLDRDFEADRPNQKWLADFTYIWTAEGWLYVAVVLDLFSRRAVGWSMKAERDASLVTGGTDNHLMLVDMIGKPVSGKDAEEALGKAHITVNKNAVPNDPRKPFVTSGLRIDTPAVTTRGYGEADCVALASRTWL